MTCVAEKHSVLSRLCSKGVTLTAMITHELDYRTLPLCAIPTLKLPNLLHLRGNSMLEGTFVYNMLTFVRQF